VNITGRLTDMIIRGGENISPREIEEFLHSHPDIRDVQVIGVPDPHLGEEVMAWIQLRPGACEIDVTALQRFAKGKLAHYKIPRYVRTLEQFPMTASGKVRKVELRDRAVLALELQQAAATRFA
jgi:fatty-acyl-CoA synthase